MRDQPGINAADEGVTMRIKARYDPCVVPQLVLIVEAMAALAALVLVDHLLRQRANADRLNG